ncbi:MAG TPA: hypothetical protein VK208_04785 [Pyrinomonadaceae bacterium]|jgi:hypothetical protein|nr:hypothetical protein [Pyrinomonadaceae bacterium]
MLFVRDVFVYYYVPKYDRLPFKTETIRFKQLSGVALTRSDQEYFRRSVRNIGKVS